MRDQTLISIHLLRDIAVLVGAIAVAIYCMTRAFYSVTEHTAVELRAAAAYQCFEDAQPLLTGNHDLWMEAAGSDDEFRLDRASWQYARNLYYGCLLSHMIDPRSVPTFDVLAPLPGSVITPLE